MRNRLWPGPLTTPIIALALSLFQSTSLAEEITIPLEGVLQGDTASRIMMEWTDDAPPQLSGYPKTASRPFFATLPFVDVEHPYFAMVAESEEGKGYDLFYVDLNHN